MCVGAEHEVLKYTRWVLDDILMSILDLSTGTIRRTVWMSFAPAHLNIYLQAEALNRGRMQIVLGGEEGQWLYM